MIDWIIDWKKKIKQKNYERRRKICDDQIWNERTLLEHITNEADETDDDEEEEDDRDDDDDDEHKDWNITACVRARAASGNCVFVVCVCIYIIFFLVVIVVV